LSACLEQLLVVSGCILPGPEVAVIVLAEGVKGRGRFVVVTVVVVAVLHSIVPVPEDPANGLEDLVPGLEDLAKGLQDLVPGLRTSSPGLRTSFHGLEDLVNGLEDLVTRA
jgi:hypothetical protein